jgi:hypothetical protein
MCWHSDERNGHPSSTKHPASNGAAIFLPSQQCVSWSCGVGNIYRSHHGTHSFSAKYCFASYHAFSFENRLSFLLVFFLSLCLSVCVISPVGIMCLNFEHVDIFLILFCACFCGIRFKVMLVFYNGWLITVIIIIGYNGITTTTSTWAGIA